MSRAIALLSLVCASCASLPSERCLGQSGSSEWQPVFLSRAARKPLERQVLGRSVWEREAWFSRDDGALRLCRIPFWSTSVCDSTYIDFEPSGDGLKAPPIDKSGAQPWSIWICSDRARATTVAPNNALERPRGQ
jgi:hypothetical protein